LIRPYTRTHITPSMRTEKLDRGMVLKASARKDLQ
jgi:hypothetical protein